ncbi:cytochrome c biogenesis protein CcsA [candidate division KSB1 bacterium]
MQKKSEPKWLFFLVLILISAALYLVFLYAPKEQTMGDVQRIFYFHVPNAWVSFLAFAVAFTGSVGFLITKDFKFDRLAASAAELGFLFTTITLITGSIWGRYAWGIWWAWEARLTSYLVLWLIFLSYLMLRSYIYEETKRAFLSAVVSIVGFFDVPIVFFSIRWWRTQHPSPVFAGGEDSGLDPTMKFVFFFCLAAYTIFFIYILRRRLELEKAREEVDYLYKLADN